MRGSAGIFCWRRADPGWRGRGGGTVRLPALPAAIRQIPAAASVRQGRRPVPAGCACPATAVAARGRSGHGAAPRATPWPAPSSVLAACGTASRLDAGAQTQCVIHPSKWSLAHWRLAAGVRSGLQLRCRLPAGPRLRRFTLGVRGMSIVHKPGVGQGNGAAEAAGWMHLATARHAATCASALCEVRSPSSTRPQSGACGRASTRPVWGQISL